MMRVFLVTVLGCAALACGGGKPPAPIGTAANPADAPADAPAPPAPEEITFPGFDDVPLSGTYYAPISPESKACFIFVHQLSSTRAEWQPIIDRLRGRAHLFAFDMRGHGASTKGPDGPLSWKTFETADWAKVEHDVGEANVLLSGKGANRACTLVGASIGSSAVLRYAGMYPGGVRALVLLSPGLGYRGLTTPDAARASMAPVLIVHSQENGAADAAGALAGIWRDAKVEVEVIADPGQAHGMKILTGDPQVLERVVAYLIEVAK